MSKGNWITLASVVMGLIIAVCAVIGVCNSVLNSQTENIREEMGLTRQVLQAGLDGIEKELKLIHKDVNTVRANSEANEQNLINHLAQNHVGLK